MGYVFGFKYITSGSINVNEVKFDIFKLKEAREAFNKYLIIFNKQEQFWAKKVLSKLLKHWNR
jgi:hypothetical protein